MIKRTRLFKPRECCHCQLSSGRRCREKRWRCESDDKWQEAAVILYRCDGDERTQAQLTQCWHSALSGH